MWNSLSSASLFFTSLPKRPTHLRNINIVAILTHGDNGLRY